MGERNRTTNIAGQRSREGTGKKVEGRGRSAGERSEGEGVGVREKVTVVRVCAVVRGIL